jgi:hypothetical protein
MTENVPLGLEAMAASFGLGFGTFLAIFIAVSVWTLAIKGYALWHAARGTQKTWFVFLLIVNTFGILELVYLLFFRPKEEEEEA